MKESPLKSLEACSRFVAQVFDRSEVVRSTVAVWSDSPFTGTDEGEVFFSNGIRLRIREEIDFEAGVIASYGYEVYRGEERLYWYDDFPHPEDTELASTYPHHKHLPPDIKHHRLPAPEISFERPNLPFLLQEIIGLGQ